jgi:hypothetical protein
MIRSPDIGWLLALSIGLDCQFRRVHHGQRMPQVTTMGYDSELHQWIVTTRVMPAIPNDAITVYFRTIMAEA